MRIAYADPPYIRQAAKHYADDPQCAEVDHAKLIERLEGFDAWALSMSAAMYSLKEIVALAPDSARMAAWVKPFASFKKGVDPAYTWEPVLFRTKRQWSREQNTVKDHVIESITMLKGLSGVKPARFSFWLFDLLGCEPDDEFHDLYPGSGAVTAAWDSWCRIKRGEPAQLELGAA